MFVDVGGGRAIHVRDDGPPDRPPVVMLHSLGTDLRIWDRQAEALSHHRVIRPDMRGHGLSETAQGPATIEALAADVLRVMDAFGVGVANIVGVSIGGMIAQVIASHGRAHRLVLCDTAMAIPPPQMWRDRAATVRAGGVAAVADAVLARWVTPDFLASPGGHGLRTMLLRTDPEGYAACCEALADADLTAATAQLRLPVLVVVGDDDESTPVTSSTALRDAIPGARLLVIPGARHIPNWENHAALTGAISGFLN